MRKEQYVGSFLTMHAIFLYLPNLRDQRVDAVSKLLGRPTNGYSQIRQPRTVY